jgi:putative ABC transport system permease protein
MVEIALAVVLLAGSGLMIRSLARLLEVRPGFSAERLLTMRVNRAPEWSRDSISRFYDVALERLAEIPGVVGVALGDCPPLGWGCSGSTPIVPRDRPPPDAGTELFTGIHWTSPEWHALLQVQLVRGRFFTPDDRQGRAPVVLISQTAASRLWPGQDPIGRPVSLGLDGLDDTARVVGVVGDVLFETMDASPHTEVYVPYHQRPLSYRMMFFLKVRGDPLAIAPAARRALREVAPGFPIHDVMSMQGRVDDALAYARFSAFVLALFAGLALLLAMIGTYGVISFSAAQRRRELGVRVALGATRGNIMKLVVGQGAVLAAIGGGCGLVGALVATRVLRSLLYEVEPADPATLAGILALLAVAVIAATWIPARRAARVPAMHALRGD